MKTEDYEVLKKLIASQELPNDIISIAKIIKAKSVKKVIKIANKELKSKTKNQ